MLAKIFQKQLELKEAEQAKTDHVAQVILPELKAELEKEMADLNQEREDYEKNREDLALNFSVDLLSSLEQRKLNVERLKQTLASELEPLQSPTDDLRFSLVEIEGLQTAYEARIF